VVGFHNYNKTNGLAAKSKKQMVTFKKKSKIKSNSIRIGKVDALLQQSRHDYCNDLKS
jgi:hypothetical protein